MDTPNTVNSEATAEFVALRSQLVTNAKLRYVTVHGREFAIANIKIIVPGVLAGSKGPLYYPPTQIANAAHIDSWNGKPLVVYHPVKDGKPISATTPDVFMMSEIGRVYNTGLDETDGGLRVEGWFDIEVTKKVDMRVWNALKDGLPIEVSTGLYTEQLKAPQNSNYNGKSYTHIAMNYRPNHLAILPDQRGACSLVDGCGVFNSTGYPEKCPYCGTALEIDPDSGVCNRCGKKVDKVTTNKDGPHSFSYVGVSLTGDLKDRVLNLGKQIEDSDLADDGRETEPHVTVLYGLHTDDPNHVKPYIEGFGKISLNVGKVSIFSGDESGKDYDVLKLEVTSDDLTALNTKLKNAPCTNAYPSYQPHATIAYVKKGLGEQYAQRLNKELSLADKLYMTDEVVFSNRDKKKTIIKLIENDTPPSLSLTNTEGNQMDRTKAIEWLVGNCDCYKSADSKNKLSKLTDNEFTAALMQNARKAVDNEDATFLEIIGNSSQDVKSAYFKLINKKVTSAIETPKIEPKVEPKNDTTTNTQTNNNNQMTDEEFLKTAPPGIVRLVENAKRQEDENRRALISKLTVNIKNADERNKEALEMYNDTNTYTTKHLEKMLRLIPTAKQQTQTNNNDNQKFQFIDAAGAVDVHNQVDDDVSNDLLTIPTVNWEEEEKLYVQNQKNRIS